MGISISRDGRTALISRGGHGAPGGSEVMLVDLQRGFVSTAKDEFGAPSGVAYSPDNAAFLVVEFAASRVQHLKLHSDTVASTMSWPQDGSLSPGSVVFTLRGFEQSHVQNPGIDPNYWAYNGDWFLMPGKVVNGRPVFENHNDTGWTHGYIAWHDGYWRGTCSSDGSPYRIGDAPWDDANRWGGKCDMLVKSDAMHPNAIDSNATCLHN